MDGSIGEGDEKHQNEDEEELVSSRSIGIEDFENFNELGLNSIPLKNKFYQKQKRLKNLLKT